MNTTLRIRLLGPLLALLALAASPAHAIRLEITGGVEAAMPVAIVPFALAPGAAAPPEDVAGIVTNDLRRSGKFEPLPLADMLSRPGSAADVQVAQWRSLGVDAVVVGRVEQSAPGKYDVQYELVDIYGATGVARGTIPGARWSGVPADNLRTLAHAISDRIYEALTGQPGPFSTHIAYVAVSGANPKARTYQLVIADSDGERPQVINTFSQPVMSLAWSPDGNRIAYVSFQDKRPEIYVQQVWQKAPIQKVAAFPGVNGSPAWSPDGRKLAVSLSKDGNPDIYILDLASGTTQQITRSWSIDTEPAWMPDGRSLLFTSDRGGKPQIYRVSASGGEPQRVTFEGNYNARPAVSPDGKFLAMVHGAGDGYQIALQDLQTRQVRVLTKGPLDEAPSFAPNGAMVMYTQGGANSRIATVSIYGRADQPVGLFRTTVREADWSPRRQ